MEEQMGHKIKPAFSLEFLKRVRELRRNATDAEKLLWELLRNRQLAGAKFRRQHPIGSYIIDFYCHDKKLAIELDGGVHTEPQQANDDAQRTENLSSEGIRVMRFWNEDVLENPEDVLKTIFGALLTE
jgi:very-short-patch-repair endonuclease